MGEIMKKFTEITSKDNKLIKLICSLQTSSKSRLKEKKFILEGLRICKDAYENSIRFDKLVVSKTAFEKHQTDIEVFSSVSNECFLLPDNLFEKISDTISPQGIICVAITPEKKTDLNIKGCYIALENINDPSNLGAISRTAEALGIDGIILTDNGCDPYSPKSLRSSMGTLLRMPLFFTDDICSIIKSNSLRSLACVVDDSAKDIRDVSFRDGDVLIIGNEANGITDKTKECSDELINVRMTGKAESLNAAAAAAITMWEMIRGKSDE